MQLVARNGTIALGGFGPGQLAQWAALEIEGELAYAHRLINVAVHGDWVILEGEVDWNYQKNGAETAVRRVLGVKGITNDLQVQPRTEAADVERRIETEFRRETQRGSDPRVRSWAESGRPQPAAGLDSA